MQFTKHLHVLHLISTIPVPALKATNYGTYWSPSPVLPKDATAIWDQLFTYIHAHWARPMSDTIVGKPTSTDMKEFIDCQDMFFMTRDELIVKLQNLPPYFREEIFPVAVARYLLLNLDLQLRPKKSTTFEEFAARYENMVTSGYYL